MKHSLPSTLLLACALSLVSPPAWSQTTTAKPAADSWPLDSKTGVVTFAGTSSQAVDAATYLRNWCMRNCYTWEEWKSTSDSVMLFQVNMLSPRRGVELRFAVRVVLRRTGYRYKLANFEIGAPTTGGIMQWLQLQRVLNDPDFRPEVEQFRARLSRAVAEL